MLLLDDAVDVLGISSYGVLGDHVGYSVEQMDLDPHPGQIGSDDELITAHVRRSKRVPFRRAVTTLAARGLVETGIAQVELEQLGQYSEYESWRDVRVAWILPAGCQYVEDHYTELLAEFPQLSLALEATGFLMNGERRHVALSADPDRLYTRSEVIRLLADEADDLSEAVLKLRHHAGKQEHFLASEIPFLREGSRKKMS